MVKREEGATLNRVHRIIDKGLEVFVILCMTLMVAFAFAQVAGRYVFSYSVTWAEEASTLVFCWTVWTTACLILRDNNHLKVDLLLKMFPAPLRRGVNLLTGLLALIALGVIAYAGFEAMDAMLGISFTTFPMPVNLKTASVPVGALLMAYYLIRGMISKNPWGCENGTN